MSRLALSVACCTVVAVQSLTAGADLGQISPKQRQDYETAYAQGRYQELVDAIEPKASGWFPQEYFFVGAANFGLATRAGAASLRCTYAGRARDLLETFLNDANGTYRASSSFGTTEDLNYLRIGVKMMEALKAFRGCEEQGYSETRLERFAIRYGRQRVRDVFFGLDADPVSVRVHEILDQHVYGRIQSLVDKAARIETRYGVISVELDAAKSRVGDLVTAINAFGPPPAAGSGSALSRGLVTFDSVGGGIVVNLDEVSRIASSLAVGRREASTALKTIRANVLAWVASDDPIAYSEKKQTTLARFESLQAALLGQAVVWKEVHNEKREGVKQFEQALLRPAPDTLADVVANVDATWRDSFRDECLADGSFWFCGDAVRGDQP